MSNAALGKRIKDEVGIDVILHVACAIGLHCDPGGYAWLSCDGMHNLVIITGDLPKMGDYPDATAVDLDSIGLLRVASQFNRGLDPAGKSIKGCTRFLMAWRRARRDRL